ncbi:MAG: hypothetical protein K6E68_02465 [Lachnospiraceae bacterium]|nr:hypothetical protein [Lachnospiraceae bacterium]
MYLKTINKIEQLYNRISGFTEQLLFPVILLLWPLIKVNQGIDISDSTYSLSNYMFAQKLDGVWIWSTYLSNALGSLFVRLPGGDTLLGMNIYTGLIISATALMCYYALKNEITAPVAFVGEFISISLCWIPSGILYNYLTYFFFNLAALLIYFAVKKRDNKLFYAAGAALGLNVFVRIPNLAQIALILAVWAGTAINGIADRRKREGTGGQVFKATCACVVGYLIGIAIPAVILDVTKGQYVFNTMISGLADMSGSNEEYTLISMIIRTAKAYAYSAKWLFVIFAVIFAGTLMIAMVKSNAALKWTARMIYVGVVTIMIRFFWGRGMFSFRYYEDYTSVYEWAMSILFLAWICVIVVLAKSGYNVLLKTYATIVLVILFVTPLGSNNFTMQNINNMFLVMPFVIYITGGWINKGTHRMRLENVLYGCNFPWMSMLIVIFGVFVIQATCFHFGFVFRDGMDGTPRDVCVEENETFPALAGMYTGADNARTLVELSEYLKSVRDGAEGADGTNDISDISDIGVTSAIYWGDCPGLAYLLRLKPAISTTWPDLESYSLSRFKEDLNDVEKGEDHPAVIVCKESVNEGKSHGDKLTELDLFLADNDYDLTFENEKYAVYRR